MNVVLYTQEFEPITVLDLPLWLLDQLEREGAARVAVMMPAMVAEEQIDYQGPPTVTIYCERLRWRDGTVKPILITPDETLAMLLRPEWLPGQRKAVNDYKKAIKTLTEGLIKAMRKS